MINSHENWTIPRQRGHEGSKLKNCLIALWVFGMKDGVWAEKTLFCARDICEVIIFQLSIHGSLDLDSILRYQNILVFLSPAIGKMQF